MLDEQHKDKSFLKKLLTFPGERILTAKRRHWFVIVSPIIVTVLLSLTFSAFGFFITVFYLESYLLFILFLLVNFTIALNLIGKLVIDWYFHLYVVTDRKILEVCYSPLFSHQICDVLLDQVRCTEVDVKINGMLNELIDRGDVVVTFDRPTHQEEFTFSQIKDPKKIGMLLGNAFHSSMQVNNSPSFWYEDRNQPGKYRFIEEIFPGNGAGLKLT